MRTICGTILAALQRKAGGTIKLCEGAIKGGNKPLLLERMGGQTMKKEK